MNRDHILFHLHEAQEELERMITKIEVESKYDFGEFVVAMSHLYHHINTAWNGRDVSSQRAVKCNKEDFARWRQFPQDIDLSA